MKYPMEWHKANLENSVINAERQRIKIRELVDSLIEFDKKNILYANQITQAEKLKKDGFDRDKFMKIKEKQK